jgi:hypothetical protein
MAGLLTLLSPKCNAIVALRYVSAP